MVAGPQPGGANRPRPCGAPCPALRRPFASHPWKGTFGDVLDLARRAATGLAARGVEAGDVVTFQTPNWIEGVVTFYATALLGAVAAPIVHIYGSRETGYILNQCRPKVHVTASRFGHQDFLANLETITGLRRMSACGHRRKGARWRLRVLRSARRRTHRLARPRRSGFARADRMDVRHDVQPEGSHPLAPDSVRRNPTTRCHLPALRAPDARGESHQSCDRDVGALLIPIDRGRPVHLLDLWDPATVLDLMMAEGLSAGGGAPYFLTSLLDHPDFTEEHLGRLEYQGMGGAPVPRVIMERATDLGIIIYKMYGSTEHPSITGCTYADELAKRLARDGRPLPGVRYGSLIPGDAMCPQVNQVRFFPGVRNASSVTQIRP